MRVHKPFFTIEHSEFQRIGISREIHIQHGGAVALDGHSLGFIFVVGKMRAVSAIKALILIIITLLLCTGLHVGWLVGSGHAVTIVVGIFIPEHHRKPRRTDFPICRITCILCRHCGRNCRGPACEGIAGLGRLAHGNCRTVPGIDRFHAVAAIQIEVHQIVVTVIVDLDDRAAVRCDFHGGIIEQRIEAFIVRSGQALAYCALGVTLLRLGVRQRVLIVRNVLLIVLDCEIHLCGVVSYGIGHRFRGIHMDYVRIRRIAHDRRAGNILRIGAAGGHGSRPGICRLCPVSKLILDGDDIDRGRRSVRRVPIGC